MDCLLVSLKENDFDHPGKLHMKILLLTPNLSEIGGISRYSRELFNSLREKRIKVSKLELVEHISPLLDYILITPLRVWSMSLRVDVAHFTFPCHGGFSLISQLLIRKNCPVVVTNYWDFWPYFFVEQSQGFKKFVSSFVDIYSMRYCLTMADVVIATSKQGKVELTQIFGLPKEKVVIVPPAISSRFLRPIRLGGKQPRVRRIVGYIGPLSGRKNVESLIMAFREAQQFNPNLELHIYSGTKPDKTLEKLLFQTPNTHFFGFVPEEALCKIYSSFDVFVFPSLYEGWGLPILEAQALGIPTIVFEYAKIPEEVTRYSFKARDIHDMARLMATAEMEEAQRREMINYARSFTWEKTISKILNVYEKALCGN